MKLIAQKDFTFKNSYYFKDDEIELNKIGTIEDISKLNENGFIKPLTLKELIDIQNELDLSKKINKKEVE